MDAGNSMRRCRFWGDGLITFPLRRSPRGKLGLDLGIGLATTNVLAATTDFHHVRFLSFLTVLAAKFAALLGRTITRPMRTFASHYFISHEKPPRRFQSSGD
jgi:hypothetical protein